MPPRDTSVAIKQAITQTINATQGHKLAFYQAITQTINATQGHKHSYQTSYYSGSKCPTRTQA